MNNVPLPWRSVPLSTLPPKRGIGVSGTRPSSESLPKRLTLHLPPSPPDSPARQARCSLLKHASACGTDNRACSCSQDTRRARANANGVSSSIIHGPPMGPRSPGEPTTIAAPPLRHHPAHRARGAQPRRAGARRAREHARFGRRTTRSQPQRTRDQQEASTRGPARSSARR